MAVIITLGNEGGYNFIVPLKVPIEIINSLIPSINIDLLNENHFDHMPSL